MNLPVGFSVVVEGEASVNYRGIIIGQRGVLLRRNGWNVQFVVAFPLKL